MIMLFMYLSMEQDLRLLVIEREMNGTINTETFLQEEISLANQVKELYHMLT
jgi:hypothetical protein